MTLTQYEAILDRNEPLMRHRNPDVRGTARDRIEFARRQFAATMMRDRA